ncbi:hypothetical protein Y032_0212g2242 [Ancylostoma ceylanicum]|uniref:Uncharacterized protein n=1 Tax=Ancylostoma ceylanicum TaxID=53326 RepID=A0A016SKR4_9BILA|nr:hypothetical protein Y032_0212g2242 [Ancylostoma ceylanicum]
MPSRRHAAASRRSCLAAAWRRLRRLQSQTFGSRLPREYAHPFVGDGDEALRLDDEDAGAKNDSGETHAYVAGRVNMYEPVQWCWTW